MFHVVTDRNGEAAIEAVYAVADDGAPEESDGDVARIVDTQIHSCPAVDKRPADHETDKQSMAHQEREEQRNAERVGGMSREESVVAATIAVDHINQ